MLIIKTFILLVGISILCFFGANGQNEITDDLSPQIAEIGKIRIALCGGAGYRTANVNDAKQPLIIQGFSKDEVDDYFNKIRFGNKVSGQVHYMFWKDYGLGIDYQYHTSSGSLSGYVDPGDMTTWVFVKVDDKVYTNYIGLSLLSQSWIKTQSLRLYSQVSFGLTIYREEVVSAYAPLLITGGAFGGNAELGLEYFLSNRLALGFSFNYFQSTISKIKTDDGNNSQNIDLEEDQKEGLQRVDMNMGLKFYF